MTFRGAVGICALAGLATASAAEGDLVGRREPRRPWPTEVVSRSWTLPRGAVEIVAPLGMNLSSDRVGDPVFLAPSVYWGATDDLMIGIRHFLGLCFTGTSGGCPDVYGDVGVDARWHLWSGGGAELAIGAALQAAPLDPFRLAAEARVLARWGGGPFAFALAPALNFGLNDRDSPGGKRIPIAFPLATYSFGWFQEVPGNREILSVPATLQIQVLPTFAAAAGAAILVPLDPPVETPKDFVTVPFGFALLVTPEGPFDVGASFTFANLLGREAWPGTRRGEMRVAQLFLAYRL